MFLVLLLVDNEDEGEALQDAVKSMRKIKNGSSNKRFIVFSLYGIIQEAVSLYVDTAHPIINQLRQAGRYKRILPVA